MMTPDLILTHLQGVLPEIGITTLMPLQAGQSNRVWLLQSQQGDCVLRWHHQQVDFAVERTTEYAVWLKLSQLKLAPELIYWDPQDRFSVARWGGVLLTPTEINLSQLVRLLDQIHRISGSFVEIDYAQRIQQYFAGGASQLLSPWLVELPNWLQQMNQSQLEPCFCHHDLHLGNLLQSPDGQLKLIDFEYAGYGHPLMDLVSWDLGFTQKQQLWRDYMAHRQLAINLTEMKAWQAGQGIQHLMNVSWAFNLAEQNPQHQPLYQSYLQQLQCWSEDKQQIG